MSAHIEPLYMEGLRGRMLRMASKNKSSNEILLIYGHHSSLERMYSIAEVMNRYGAVTMPDLPGFGGMEPFYKLGLAPNFDNYADYLSAFIKLRYKRKKVVIMAMSFAVPLITYTLQKYPEIAKKVKFVVGVAGFTHKEDFIFSKQNYYLLRVFSWLGSRRIISGFLKTFVFQPYLIKATYRYLVPKHTKLKDATEMQREERINFEVKLWQVNDLRTWMYTLNQMLQIDLCSKQLKMAMYNVVPQSDAYFNDHVVEQHMNIIFESYTKYETPLKAHVPSIVASADEIDPYFPKKLHTLLANM